MTTKYSAIAIWGKEKIEFELDPSAGVDGLKAQLQALSGVPSERMKVMPKSKGLWKGVLKDTEDLASLNLASIAPPISMLMMGSATLPIEPVKKTVFLEDLPPEMAAQMVEPSGLVNLGNTCYLNSVTQCLRVIPHLRDGLKHYTPGNSNGSAGDNRQTQMNALLLKSLLSTLDALDRSPAAISPQNLVMSTKMAFPQMAATGPGGHPMQQDAEEFYSSILGAAATELRGEAVIRAAFHGEKCGSDELNGANNVIDAVFGLKMEETLTCDELTTTTSTTSVGDEAMETDNDDTMTSAMEIKHDNMRKLTCNIQGGSDSSSQVNVTHIVEGIQLALTGKVEKHCDALGRNAMYTRTQRIARLPPYLVVQFGRFYWKATPDSQDHAGVKCKVMKPVGFQSVLDVYEFCTDKLKKTLKVARDKALKDEEDRLAKKLKGEEEDEKKEESGGDVAASAMESEKVESEEKNVLVEEDEMDDDLKAALAMSVEPAEYEVQSPVGPGLPSNFRGLYELFAVVTHKGRDADGGHYMGWVKADNSDTRNVNPTNKRDKIGDTNEDNDDWYVFDDDEVSPCKTEDILKLKGGGDWHMSYLNFYRAKK